MLPDAGAQGLWGYEAGTCPFSNIVVPMMVLVKLQWKGVMVP